jgi:hypothetical protein
METIKKLDDIETINPSRDSRILAEIQLSLDAMRNITELKRREMSIFVEAWRSHRLVPSYRMHRPLRKGFVIDDQGRRIMNYFVLGKTVYDVTAGRPRSVGKAGWFKAKIDGRVYRIDHTRNENKYAGKESYLFNREF